MKANGETERMLRENRRREQELPPDFYARHKPANLFLRHGQERAFVRALAHRELLPLAGKRILDVGCGTGSWFSFWSDLGAHPGDLAGADLDSVRLARARAVHPLVDLRCTSVTELPWDDGRFDLVAQTTLFTSILDPETRVAAADEMLRVLAPGGSVLWYDFAVDNPTNPHVRGVGARELATLFPGCESARWRVTLAPPIARRLVPHSHTLAALLEGTRLFNTHLVAVLWRTAGGTPAP